MKQKKLGMHFLESASCCIDGRNIQRSRRKKWTHLSTMLILIASLFFSTNSVWAQYDFSGTGTSSNPFLINNLSDWQRFRTHIDNDNRTYQERYWKLTTDLNVGSYSCVGRNTDFEGYFDGGGHSIRMSSINNSTWWYVGLFGATYNSEISNLNVSCGYIDGNDWVGCLVGQVRGYTKIYNCHVSLTGSSSTYGQIQGGLIGGAVNGENKELIIEFCSVYMYEIKLNDATSTNNWFDWGGLIGRIESSYSKATIKDCLVRITSLSTSCDDYTVGGLVGVIKCKANVIRCVTDVNVPKSGTLARGQVIGNITSGTTTIRDCYYTKSGTAVGGGSYSGSTPTHSASWGDYDWEYDRLERKNDSGSALPTSSRGNERWGVLYSDCPGLTNTYYAIQIIKGSGIGSISGKGYVESTTKYHRAANTDYDVEASPAPAAHQRVKWSFSPAYNASSSPNYTGTVLNDSTWRLNSKVDGTLSATLLSIPYPYTNVTTKDNHFNATLAPFDTKINLNWKYDNPHNLSGKFYVYLKESGTSTYKNITPSGIVLQSGTDKSAAYDITSENFQFEKKYDIIVAYWEGTSVPSIPTDIKEADRYSLSNFSTSVELPGWSANAEDGMNKITVRITGVDSRLSKFPSYSYKVQRSINGGAYEEWISNQVFADTTIYVHENTGITTPCDAYKYKVIISAFNTIFEKETGEAHSSGITQFLEKESFKATKGEHSGYVRLQWNVNRSTGGSDDTYKVFRRTANSTEKWTEMETVTSNSGAVYWSDNNALTGVFYEYKVVLYQNCSSELTQLAERTDIGFSQAFGTVSGRITYGTSDDAVSDVDVLVRNNQLQEGESQYHSLSSIGGSQKFEWLADASYFNSIWTGKNWSLQFWVNPSNTNAGTKTIGYIGSLPIYMTAVTGGYQVSWINSAANYRSEIIAANKFSHISIVRNGNEVKIYTVCDENVDSVYIKNKPFTYTAATEESAANSRIMLGNTLVGNIDDVRFWNKSLTEAEILGDYSRILVGDEKDLMGYWTFDENLAGYAFDRSRVGTVYNGNHATTNTLSSSTLVPDDTYQLALKAITDKDGNYQISGIAYQGEGTSYSIVPSFGEHTFNPTQELRYISQHSMVHNGTNFKDNSSFILRGKVVYEGGNYPVSDCQFEVDGKTVTLSNGNLVKTDNAGQFELSVPIGKHSVRVVKTGHTFANDGYLKDENGIDFLFNSPKAGIIFSDQTKVKLIGRIVGGDSEDSKPLGFGESINNIGVETIELRSTRQMYDFVDTPTSEIYNHNNGQWTKPNAILNDDQTTVVYNQKNIIVQVSPISGEFSALVYPEPYDIQPISVTQGLNQPLLIIKDNAENIDLTTAAVPDDSYLQYETRVWTDSIYRVNQPGVVDHWEYVEKSDTVRYASKWTYKYQATPTFGVTQVVSDEEVPYLGEKTFKLKDPLSGDEEVLALYDETTATYMFDKPVFQQGNRYYLRFNAYEEYTNYVSNPIAKVTYPISNGSVNMTNNLQVTAEPETLEMDSLGILNYSFIAGAPNLTTASGDIFATLTLGAVSYYWDLGTDPLEAWQLGEKTTGTNFMTSGPDQLSAILRDPPGSNSSAFIEKGSSVSSTSTLNVSEALKEELKFNASLGGELTIFTGIGAGVIIKTELTAEQGYGMSTELTYGYDNEQTTTTTFVERFETSSSSEYVGAMGDVFIGNSTNILYGMTNGVQIKKGVADGTPWQTKGEYKIVPSSALAYGQQFSTRFAYTTFELENIMIPKWKLSIAERLQPVGTVVNPDRIEEPVYVSKLEPTDPNYGKWNSDDDAFGDVPGYSALKAFDGLSYKIYFPSAWTDDSEEMKNFQDSVLWANNQINTWEAVLAQNEKEKVEMTHRGNYSFGGGASIQYSESGTSSSSYSHSFGCTLTPALTTSVGIKAGGIGFKLENEISLATSIGGSTGGGKEETITTGFILAEEGNNDEITLDYGMTDSGTFAFKTRGGQTSCPYEGAVLSKYYQAGQHILQEATMRIEVPVLELSSASQVLNVPANRTASFKLALQNESEINEDVWFQLIVDEKTNPNGAELKIDGIGIGNGRTFLVKAGETLTKTMTLGKGSVDDYDNIGIILRSMCQNDPTGAWPVIADTTWVTAHFVPACSDVKIASPANNFVVNTESKTGNVLSVTLQDFDVNFPNFGYVRLEYRPLGSPDWSTARTFYPENLFASPTNSDGTKESIGGRAAITYDWAMPSEDGLYELRAVTASVNVVNNAIVGQPLSTYVTEAILGYKDMTKPMALGLPSPSNGIYSVGDELSVTFNEEINTSMVTDNSIVVTYGESKTVVPVTFVVSANKVTFDYPRDYDVLLEGETLDITVKGIYDMRGNVSDPITWTALVNRNALVWDNSEINLVKEAGEVLQFTAVIRNTGSTLLSYSVINLPQWLSVDQPTGNLQPLTNRELTFSISSGLNLGDTKAQIGLTSGNQIIKNLPINLTVTGIQPDWNVNPSDYESSMTVTGKIQFDGKFQYDGADILAAFIEDVCVGKTSPIQPVENSNEYYTFLTVYGNAASAGKVIKFKIWDASTDAVYSVVESKVNGSKRDITFSSDAILGSASTPIVHNALNIVELSMELNDGWNWISVNVLNDNPTILQQFVNRIGEAGELLKGLDGYNQAPTWSGNLASIEKEQAYFVKTNASTVLRFDGTPADPESSPITLASGWNWIGYVPSFILPVNEALQNLNAQTDDQIKGQFSYRTYAGENVGWIGTLDYLRPGEGYMYNSGKSENTSFKYPSSSSQVYTAGLRSGSMQVESRWTPVSRKYPNTMTMTSIVLDDNIELYDGVIEIAAFDINDECRGSVMLQNVPQLTEHPYLGFLMVFGEPGDELKIKIYNHDREEEYATSNEVVFVTDAVFGTPINPYPIMRIATGVNDIKLKQRISIYPNPVADWLIIDSNLAIKEVRIMDALGNLVIFDDSRTNDKINVSGLKGKLYTIHILTEEGLSVMKFIKK